MTGLAFFFEENDIDVYSGRSIDLDAWYLAAQLSGDVNEILVVNRTNQNLISPNSDFKFTVVDEMPDLPNAVYLDPQRGSILWDIDHDRIDWYVIGPADGWDTITRNYIHIPQNGSGHAHSAHIATTCMLHRYWGMK